MTLMISWPKLAAKFDVNISQSSPAELRALAELATFLRDCDFECSQSLILEAFRGKPEGGFISEALAASVTGVVPDEASSNAEFLDYQEKFKSDQRRARRNELVRKAAEGPLSESESQEYRALS